MLLLSNMLSWLIGGVLATHSGEEWQLNSALSKSCTDTLSTSLIHSQKPTLYDLFHNLFITVIFDYYDFYAALPLSKEFILKR